MNNYSRHFARRGLVQFLIGFTIYSMFILLLFFIYRFILRDRVFYGDEFLYPFYHWANNNTVVLIGLVIVVGMMVIVSILYIRNLKFIDEMIGKLDEVYTADETVIVLSPELQDVAVKMNEVKMDLRLSREQAESAERRKNDLVMYLAHDLKTPLTSIIGYLNILKEEKDLTPRFQEKYLQVSHKKALRLEDLINEFFEITRYNLNEVVVEKATINFSLMMAQVMDEFKPLLDEKNLMIEAEVAKDLMVVIDAVKIERVLDNVFKNAINYAYENSVITVAVKRVSVNVVVTIENSGPTISKEKIARIFDEFYRVDSARGTDTGGAGVGLAIAKRIVGAHDGLIEAESSDERIKVIMSLPL